MLSSVYAFEWYILVGALLKGGGVGSLAQPHSRPGSVGSWDVQL